MYTHTHYLVSGTSWRGVGEIYLHGSEVVKNINYWQERFWTITYVDSRKHFLIFSSGVWQGSIFGNIGYKMFNFFILKRSPLPASPSNPLLQEVENAALFLLSATCVGWFQTCTRLWSNYGFATTDSPESLYTNFLTIFPTFRTWAQKDFKGKACLF